VTLGGLRFHYRDWGSPSAPPLVLLHGYQGNARQWDTLAQAMVARYRVLALDQRGHGESAWPTDGDYRPERVVEDFAAFVDALGLAQCSVVAFSFGGHVAYSYAAAHPERISQLVMMESSIPPPTPAWEALLAAVVGLPLVFDTPDGAVRQFNAVGLASSTPEDELRHWVLTGLVQQSDGRWAWRMDPALVRRDPLGRERLTQPADVMWSLLPRVQCPTLLVRGEETVAFPLDLAARMAAVMPNARVASIPAAGHWPALENPSGVIAVVQQFLAETGAVISACAG
jgi:pimeloyl-ACP methyl ester carboxylesterase